MPWELTGNSGTSPATDFLGTRDLQPLVIKTNGAEAMRIDPSGNVGLGTRPTSSKLEIAAQDGLQIHGYQPFLTLKDTNSNGARGRIQTADGKIGFMTEAGFATGTAALTILNSGTVEIVNQDALRIIGYQPFLTLIDTNSGGARGRIQTADGKIGFMTEAGFATGKAALTILNSGEVEVERDIILRGGDCAEDFDVVEPENVEPGSVMVIDQEGELRQCEKAYDRRVAGVISGAGNCRPGIILDKQQSNRK